MATATLNMKPGRYFAGINRPWYAGQDAVRKEIGKRLGLTEIVFYPRSTKLPAGIDPKKLDPRYEDGWDEWVAARYAGEAKQLTTDRLWQWVLRVNDSSAAALPALPPPPQPSAGAGGALVVVGGLGALAFSIWYARRAA